MPASKTRRVRNTAAVLMLASGISHIAQLWFRDVDASALLLALTGMYYLVLALGLSGRSRFTLWITTASVAASASFGLLEWSPQSPEMLLAWHILIDAAVALLCLYVLYQNRYSLMD